MSTKKSNIRDWLYAGTKNEVFIKKLLSIVLTVYIIYLLGYGIGTFWVHLGL